MGLYNDEYLDESGAHILARKIRQFWARRDLYPRVEVKAVYLSASPSDAERPIFCVRSDMVAGMPRHV